MSKNGNSQKVSENKIFVGGLGVGTTEANIIEYFTQFGKIDSSEVFLSRGFAYVSYKDPMAVDRCLHHGYHSINSKWVDVKRSFPPRGKGEAGKESKGERSFAAALQKGGPASGKSNSTTGPVPTAAPPATVSASTTNNRNVITDGRLNKMVSMGFGLKQSKRVLAECGWDLNAALDRLFEEEIEVDEEDNVPATPAPAPAPSKGAKNLTENASTASGSLEDDDEERKRDHQNGETSTSSYREPTTNSSANSAWGVQGPEKIIEEATEEPVFTSKEPVALSQEEDPAEEYWQQTEEQAEPYRDEQSGLTGWSSILAGGLDKENNQAEPEAAKYDYAQNVNGWNNVQNSVQPIPAQQQPQQLPHQENGATNMDPSTTDAYGNFYQPQQQQQPHAGIRYNDMNDMNRMAQQQPQQPQRFGMEQQQYYGHQQQQQPQPQPQQHHPQQQQVVDNNGYYGMRQQQTEPMNDPNSDTKVTLTPTEPFDAGQQSYNQQQPMLTISQPLEQQKIEIMLYNTYESGWSYGKDVTTQRQGWFPTSCITFDIVEAMYNFDQKPENSRHYITFRPTQRIIVEKRDARGWWYGSAIKEDDNLGTVEVRGYFPGNYTRGCSEPIPPSN